MHAVRSLETDARHNACTQVVVTPWQHVPRNDYRSTFIQHFAALRAYRDARTEVGYIAAIVDPGGDLSQLVVLTAPQGSRHGGMCSFGRHTHADVRLVGDPAVALRHFVTRIYLDDRGVPQLRLYDLRTPLGLDVDGVGACAALGVDGDVFVHVGGYGVMFLPLAAQRIAWPEDAVAAWESRQAMQIIDSRAHVVDASAPNAKIERRITERQRADDVESTSITVFDAVIDMPPVAAEAALTEEMTHVLEVRTARGQALVGLRPVDLERGVLIGRYERCEQFAPLLWEASAVSRVHLLLFTLGDELVAFDVGSSFGTELDGVVVRFFAWELGATVHLGRGAAVRLGQVVESAAAFPVAPIDWSQN